MRIQFGPLELDEERFLLQRDGVRLDIRPKVFDLLVLLVRSRERVVLRDELVMALWGTTSVGLGSLSGLVNELRQALGESGRGPSSIRTVHGRGYQFVACVDGNGIGTNAGPLHTGEGIKEGQSTQIGKRIFGPVAIAGDQIRASAARASAEGARATIVAGPPGSGRSRALDHVRAELANSGFGIIRSTDATKVHGRPDSLVDLVLSALVESLGLAAIRLAIPLAARELTERVLGERFSSRARFRDPLAARQYEDRVARSLRDLMLKLTDVRPFVFLLEDRECSEVVAIQLVQKLLRLVGEARILVLCIASARECTDLETVVESSDPFIEIVRLVPAEHVELNEMLEALGVDVFPAAIADAIAAHVRGDVKSLECVANWLCAEKRRTRCVPSDARPVSRERAMKRVEPESSSRRIAQETA